MSKWRSGIYQANLINPFLELPPWPVFDNKPFGITPSAFIKMFISYGEPPPSGKGRFDV